MFAPKGPRERIRIKRASVLELLKAKARMAENARQPAENDVANHTGI